MSTENYSKKLCLIFFSFSSGDGASISSLVFSCSVDSIDNNFVSRSFASASSDFVSASCSRSNSTISDWSTGVSTCPFWSFSAVSDCPLWSISDGLCVSDCPLPFPLLFGSGFRLPSKNLSNSATWTIWSPRAFVLVLNLPEILFNVEKKGCPFVGIAVSRLLFVFQSLFCGH